MSEFPALLGEGVLINWMDVLPDTEAQFNDWYTHEHLPERVGIPGFLRGRRFVASDPDAHQDGKWFTVYETETLDTLASEPYLARLNNPTPWTTQIVQSLRYLSRTACNVTVSRGIGTGAHVATLEFGAAEGHADELRDWLRDTAFPRLENERHVVAVHLFEADPEITQVKDKTAEGGSTGTPGQQARWIVFAELSEAGRGAAVRETLLGSGGVESHGSSGDQTYRTFATVVEVLSPNLMP
jgi:hypothetical protein